MTTTGIRHGIVVVPELRWREAAPRWSAAEELGFDHAWTYDHLVWGGLPDSPVFAFAPTLALASTVTSTIGLGVFVASPNFRHPYVLARDAITLDDASGGRFLLGVGAGGDLDSRHPRRGPAAAGAGRPVPRVHRRCSTACCATTTSTTTASSTPPATRAPSPSRCASACPWWSPATGRARWPWPPGSATRGRPTAARATPSTSGSPTWRAWRPASTTRARRHGRGPPRPLPPARRLAALRPRVGRASTPTWPGAPPSSASPTSSPTGRAPTARMPVTWRSLEAVAVHRPPPLSHVGCDRSVTRGTRTTRGSVVGCAEPPAGSTRHRHLVASAVACPVRRACPCPSASTPSSPAGVAVPPGPDVPELVGLAVRCGRHARHRDRGLAELLL